MKIEETAVLYLKPDIKPLSSMEAPPDVGFSDFLSDTLHTTNQKLLAADSALQQLASGHANSLHQTMLTLEEAKLSFQFLEQIRNRLMMAYQDVLKESI